MRPPGFFAAVLGLLTACDLEPIARDMRDYEQREHSSLRPSGLRAQSWDVCRLVAPTNADEGVYGTDLGFAVPDPTRTDQLAVLFGDTWAEAADACQYPVETHDDLQASLPRARPEALSVGVPEGDRSRACGMVSYAVDDANDPTSWRPMRLFESEDARAEDVPLDTGALRTPVAAFGDGEALFALFSRGDPAPCDACALGMTCSDSGEPLGRCGQLFALSPDPVPVFCRSDEDCAQGACDFEAEPVCLDEAAFEPGIDRRLAVAQTLYLARAAWSEHPEDYLIEQRFVTRRFVNVTARTVARFDPDDPENNDYAPGHDALLLFGRPAFVTTQGVQSLPYLLYHPIAELRDADGAAQWRPRFFAGYGADGRVRWSEHERDAKPIYGDDGEPEFDYVNQMSVSYVAPLGRFLMLYGGDVPAFLVMQPDGTVPAPVHVQPAPGAVHMRSARHPWGRATLDAPEADAWTSPEPVLTREGAAGQLACSDAEEPAGCTEGDSNGPLDLLATLAEVAVTMPGEALDITGDCLMGGAALVAQTELLSGDSTGRLYGASIIEEWTADVTDQLSDLASGERAVEIYWNVSTWNPYQVVLTKTQLRGPTP